MLRLPLMLLLGVIVHIAQAQIEGPNADGNTYFYFNNYTGVFIMHDLIPNIEFHPVLGGSALKYIRYQNRMVVNFTDVTEIDASGHVVEQVHSHNLSWTFVSNEVTNHTTGNIHTYGSLYATAPNGARIALAMEAWSQGDTHQYGSYENAVPPSAIEITFNVKSWPFMNPSNYLCLTMQIHLDGGAVPYLNVSNPYQFEATFATNITTFSIWLMTYGIIDGSMTSLEYSFPIDISDLSDYTFTVIAPAFEDNYTYDPNFTVLLNDQPDCPKLHECVNGGVCVEENTCLCQSGFGGSDCSTKLDPNARTTSSNLSTLQYCAIVGVAAVLVVAFAMSVMLWRKRKIRRMRRSSSVLITTRLQNALML